MFISSPLAENILIQGPQTFVLRIQTARN